MARRDITRRCVEPGCHESGYFEVGSNREAASIPHEWRCTRHTRLVITARIEPAPLADPGDTP